MVFIYVLELQNNKYYIGKTSNPYFRFDTHFTNNGSEWTKLHKPIKILELITNCDNYDEDKYTYIYMDKYGIDNVRGGSYTSTILDKETKNQLVKISNSINNRCFICSNIGHFAKDCRNFANQTMTTLCSSPLSPTSPNDYLHLQTLLTFTPNIIQQYIKDLEIISQLKIYRIKVGDRILNYDKLEYNSLKELVNDATKYYNYDENDLIKIPGITTIDIAKEIKNYLRLFKIEFYKNISNLLNLLSTDICKLVQSGYIFTELESIIYNTK
jgi:hypothetical protein